MMKGKSTFSFYDWGCCTNCVIAFIDDREDRWRSGWRPTKDEVDSYYSSLFPDN